MTKNDKFSSNVYFIGKVLIAFALFDYNASNTFMKFYTLQKDGIESSFVVS